MCTVANVIAESAMHDSMLKVLEIAEAKRGLIAEASVRNGGLNQETVDDIKEMDRRLYQRLVVCTEGSAKNYVCNPKRSSFNAWKQMANHLDPRRGADISVAYSSVTHPSEHEWADINKAEDTARREEHTAVWGQED